MNSFIKNPFDGPRQIEFTASDEVLVALKDLGRTEDVVFSPSSRRLAIAGFAKNKILIIDVNIVVSAAGKSVVLTDFVEIKSSSFRAPHGICFINEETLVVVSRGASASILSLPPSGSVEKKIVLPDLQTLPEDQVNLLKTPGSVSVSKVDDNIYEILVCNNYVHYVTRHIVEGGKDFSFKSTEVLLGKGLSVPDGVAVNRDGRWIAVSNHNTHSVFLYKNTEQLNLESKPDGILRDLNFPHGLRFTPDDKFLLVADAGSAYVNVYANDARGWGGTRHPVATIRVMDEMTYRSGRYNPQEGGGKGIDIDKDMNVLVVTCEQQPLAFFDLAEVLKMRGISMNWRKESILWKSARTKAFLVRLMDWRRDSLLWRVEKIKALFQSRRN